jgi:acetate kinase
MDPGILVHLLRTGSSADGLDNILNRQSGLLGVSGLSSDMRAIVQAMRNGNEKAKLAFDIFIHRLCSCIAAMAASLQGLDVLVFTAGIGENSCEVRSAACARLGFLGISLNQGKNAGIRSDTEISLGDSRVRVLVIRAQEDWSIAQTCVRLLA